MAIDKIIIEVTGNAQGVKPVIDDLEKLGAVDKKNAEQFRKTNDEFKRAAAERKKRIDEETQDLAELQIAKKKAFSVEDIKQYNDRITETKNRISTLKGETGKMAGFLKGQFAALGGAIAGAFAVTQLVAFGKEAVNVAAAGEGIRNTFEKINKGGLLEELRTATKGTVSDLELMKSAIQANNFQIPLENLGTLLKFAQVRAQQTGQSVDYLVESIILGISRKSIPILDNLGISAGRLRQEFAATGNFAQGAFNIVNEELGKAGETFTSTADRLAAMNASWENLKETIGSALISAGWGLVGTLDALTLGAFDLTDANYALEDSEDGVQKSFVKTKEEGEKLSKQLIEGIISLKEFQIAQLNGGAGTEELRKSIEELKQSIAPVTKEAKTYGETIGEIEQRISDLQEAQKSLIPNTQELRDNVADIAKWEKILKEALGKTTGAIKEQKKALDDVPTEMLENMMEGQRAQLEAEEKARLKSLELAQAGADEATRIKAEEVAERLRLDDILAENEKKNQEELTANLEAEARRRQQIEQALQQAVSQLVTMAIDYQLSLSQKATDYELDLLQDRFDAKKITEEQYNSQRRAILKDQAQKQKEAAIIKATIDTANAVINAFSEGGPVLAAIAGAVGIAQLAIISATPIPEFEKGGRIGGKRHRDGGTPLIAEKDEFIINRKAASKIGFDNLEMLNRGIVPVKLLKQGISESRDKKMENTLKAVFGSNDFDTYPIEKELRKNRKHDTELTHLLIKNLKQGSRKRGGY